MQMNKELGPVDTVRFVIMPKKKQMDSVIRHREWQSTLSKDVFLGKYSNAEHLPAN
jgi:hypothetical protein